MKFVSGYVMYGGALENVVESRAYALEKRIVQSTNQNMDLGKEAVEEKNLEHAS